MSDDDIIGHMSYVCTVSLIVPYRSNLTPSTLNSLLLLAATDTTSTTLTRAIEVLAHRPDAQARLRQELQDATAGTGRTLADFDYDAYTSLPYLEAVVRETIRMYPSFHLSPRVCVPPPLPPALRHPTDC